MSHDYEFERYNIPLAPEDAGLVRAFLFTLDPWLYAGKIQVLHDNTREPAGGHTHYHNNKLHLVWVGKDGQRIHAHIPLRHGYDKAKVQWVVGSFFRMYGGSRDLQQGAVIRRILQSFLNIGGLS